MESMWELQKLLLTFWKAQSVLLLVEVQHH
jgi:hypothetical protein